MTRINCIDVKRLSGKHLVAEYRELPRVFGLVRRAQQRGEQPDRSGTYTMGKGHVRFFYARLRWLVKRHDELVREMRRRGYQPRYTEPQTDGIGVEWFGSWTPMAADKLTNMARLRERDAKHYCAK